MMDGGKYSLELFEEGCRRVTPLNVQYKTEKETEWQATIRHYKQQYQIGVLQSPKTPENWKLNFLNQT